MNRRAWILFVVGFALIAGTCGLLARISTHQRLTPPGVKTHPSNEAGRLVIELPAQVLNCTSVWVEVDKVSKGALPQDTSFGARDYTAPDGFRMLLNVVLMGTDRTSLHKPQFCLEGIGLHLDAAALSTNLRIDRPCAYDLPVVRLLASGEQTIEGQKQPIRAVYVYWYVANDALSASQSGFQRMWKMGSTLLRTGVLQRWAYVSCLSYCYPGQEEATFERMKQLIVAAVPEFQLYPPAPGTEVSGKN